MDCRSRGGWCLGLLKELKALVLLPVLLVRDFRHEDDEADPTVADDEEDDEDDET